MSENGRPEISAKNKRFPAKAGGLESLLFFFARFAVGVTPLYGPCRHVALTGTVITCVTTRNDLTLMKLESRYRFSLVSDTDMIAKLFSVIK